MADRTLNLDAVRESDLFADTGKADKPKVTAHTTGEPKKRGRPAGARTDTTRKAESELRGRLERTFDRIAEALEGRGDEELSSAISEDAKAMTSGLISLTRAITPLRAPLLILLALVEPLLAFGRVGRILLVRYQMRRVAAAMMAQEAQDAQSPPDPYAAAMVDPLAPQV
jgi:hypothetical protein